MRNSGQMTIGKTYPRLLKPTLAHICGDGGIIKIIDFWCPEVIEVTRYRDTGKNAKEILPVGKSPLTLGTTNKVLTYSNQSRTI